jgi:hypothetical protein
MSGDAPITPAPVREGNPVPVAVSNNRAASYAANMWVAGFASASTSRMVRISAVPFSAGGDTAATTPKELESVYEGLLVESGPLKDWQLLSPREFRQREGGGGTFGDGSLVIAIATSKERFGIVLTPTRSGEFRATHILR